MIKDVDYYIDPSGKCVFTAAYHKARGYCCGQACRHCPYDYEAVPEPIKTRAQLISAAAKETVPNAEIIIKDSSKHL